MRRSLRVVALVAIASLGALALAAPATAKGPPGFFGLVPQGEKPSSADIERMGQGRVGTVRLLINWPSVEPTDDQFDFASLDKYIGDLAAAGVRPLPFVWGSPGFVNANNLEMPVGPAADEEQWKEFVREVVGRYGQGGDYWTTEFPTQHPGEQALPVDTLQIWNEENAPKHVDKPDPAGYARLLELSRSAANAEDPSIELILGGMFGQPRGSGGLKAWSFLKRMYKVPGVKNNFDGVSLHPYSPDVDGIEEQVEQIRKALKKGKDKAAEVWITELGWGSKNKGRLGVGKKQQSKLLKGSFKLLLKKRGKWNIGGVLWYTFRDLSKADAPCDWCASAGLFKQNGTTPKPAWKSYVRFTGGS